MTRGHGRNLVAWALATAVSLASGWARAASDETLCGGVVSPSDGAPPRYAILSGSMAGTSTAGPVTYGPSGWFDEAIPHRALGYPNSAAAADLDGDGRMDLALAGTGADSLTLFFGAVDPLVETRRGLPLPGRPFDVASGDLDGDGRPDLVCSLWNRSEIAVMRGTSGATSWSIATWPVGDEPRGVAVADLDGDGDLDVAVACAGTNSVWVLRNRGDATFQPTTECFVGSGPAMLLATDVDGDGLPDLVTADQGCQTVSCLVNVGGATFAPRLTTRIPTTPYGIAAADLDGDGHVDLAMSGSSRGAVLWGDGTGRFSIDPTIVPPADYEMAGVATVDLDGDDRPEVLLIEDYLYMNGRSGFGHLRVYHNRGGRLFERGPIYRTPMYTQFILAADLDRDGRRDVTVVSAWKASDGYPTGAATLLNRGNGTLGGMLHLQIGPPNSVGESIVKLASVTLRADGIMDLVSQRRLGGVHDLLLSRNRGAHGFDAPVGIATARLASVADLDRDGGSDLVTFHGDTVEVRLGRLTGDFSPPAATLRGLVRGTADLDGDGRLDLLLQDSLQQVLVAHGRGDGTFDAPRPTEVTLTSHAPGSWYGYTDRLAALDLDGDGLDDFVTDFKSTSESPDSLVVYRNRGAARFDSVATLAFLPPDSEYDLSSVRVLQMLATDVDGDGRKDVLILSQGYPGTYLSTLFLRPTGPELVHGMRWGYSEIWHMTVGDYDRDGRLDVIIADVHSDDPGLLHFLHGNGNGTFETRLEGHYGDYTSAVTTGRFDADGTPDVAFTNRRINSVEVLFGSHRDGNPTPALASLVSAEFADGAAHLVWHVSGAAIATIQRSDDVATWTARAQLAPDGDGRVRFDDPDVLPGRRYGWRLALTEGGATITTAETWLDIPGAAALALVGASPNPVEGDLTVAFTLPSRTEATLGLFDLAGRRLASREVGALGAGTHRIRLAEREALKPGLYFVRLATRERTLVARAVVTR